MKMKKFIRGKIIKIEDEHTIILDLTTDLGVEEGMIFIVYEEGEEIFDSGGESLGKIEYPKAEVKIINVSSNFSVAESNEWYYDIPSPYDPYYDDFDLDEPYKKQKKIAEFPEKKEKIKNQKSEKKKSLSAKIKGKRRIRFVVVGDLVKSNKPISPD